MVISMIIKNNFLFSSIPQIKSYVSSPVANVRATVINALRFIVVEQPRPVDNYLRPVIGKFLNAVRDKDMNVRRVAIVTLNSAAHNKPKMVAKIFNVLILFHRCARGAIVAFRRLI